MALLHNRVDKQILKQKLAEESFKRTTISFYRYVILEDPSAFRDKLYQEWTTLNCFGRIYVAREGINAQMSIPNQNLEAFLEILDSNPELENMPIKYAVEDDGKSFYKLIIKNRQRAIGMEITGASST